VYSCKGHEDGFLVGKVNAKHGRTKTEGTATSDVRCPKPTFVRSSDLDISFGVRKKYKGAVGYKNNMHLHKTESTNAIQVVASTLPLKLRSSKQTKQSDLTKTLDKAGNENEFYPRIEE